VKRPKKEDNTYTHTCRGGGVGVGGVQHWRQQGVKDFGEWGSKSANNGAQIYDSPTRLDGF